MVAQVAGRVIWLIGTAVAASAATASVMRYVNRGNVQKAKDAGKREGEAREKARQEEAFKQSSAATAEMLAQLAENQKLHRLVLALVTVGAACAASLGPITSQDRLDIEEYVMGVSRSELPDYIRTKVEHAFATPTDVKTAYALAAKYATSQGWAHFDELVHLVATLKSGEPFHGSASFASEWYYLRSAA
ncbi:hypothetical protein [Pseudomonas huaxiensis]|uniref:hypothetical protein n=1 Tax=Pseudomonas huaxiensis TaxID=2213017 RepID=UPI000DA65D66|nr:hypothetical protein [Pseudomonas huaxiensis]